MDDELFSMAQTAYLGGQYDVAVELCGQIINKDSTCAEAYSLSGKAYLMIDKLEDAEKCFKTTIDLNNQRGENFFDLANAEFGLRKYNNALAYYSKAEKLGCSNEIRKQLFYQLGVINMLSGDTVSAMANFNKSQDLEGVNHNQRDIILNKLRICVNTENFADAEDLAYQLKLLEPHSFNGYSLFAQILAQQGKTEQALLVLDEAEMRFVDDDLTTANIGINRAAIYRFMAQQDPTRADEYLKKAAIPLTKLLKINSLPDIARADVNLALAQTFLQLKNYKNAGHYALEAYEYYKNKDGDEKEHATAITAECYKSLNNYEKALPLVRMFKLSKNPVYQYVALYHEAFLTMKLEGTTTLYMDAINFYRQQMRANPTDVLAITYRVKACADIKDFTQAWQLIKPLMPELKEVLSSYVQEQENTN